MVSLKVYLHFKSLECVLQECGREVNSVVKIKFQTLLETCGLGLEVSDEIAK